MESGQVLVLLIRHCLQRLYIKMNAKATSFYLTHEKRVCTTQIIINAKNMTNLLDIETNNLK